MATNQDLSVEVLSVGSIELELIRRGSGRAVLVLHGMSNFNPDTPFLAHLSAETEVFAPSHPGFGHSERPEDFDTVYDLVHLYLALIDTLGLDKLTLIGCSFGGWLAAELAVKSCARLERLILVDPLGIKLSARETPDILDVFNTSPEVVKRRRWHDYTKHAPDFDAMSDEQIIVHARNWDALCLYGWHPYMYTPQLHRWLHLISCPTLVIWGEHDGIVTPDYGRAYSALIPGARFACMAGAGHEPHIEQPQAFSERVLRFINQTS